MTSNTIYIVYVLHILISIRSFQDQALNYLKQASHVKFTPPSQNLSADPTL